MAGSAGSEVIACSAPTRVAENCCGGGGANCGGSAPLANCGAPARCMPPYAYGAGAGAPPPTFSPPLVEAAAEDAFDADAVIPSETPRCGEKCADAAATGWNALWPAPPLAPAGCCSVHAGRLIFSWGGGGEEDEDDGEDEEAGC